MKNLTIYTRKCRPLKHSKNTLLDTLKQSKIFCTVNLYNNDIYYVVDDTLFIVPHKKECSATSVKIIESTNLVHLEFCGIRQQLYCICDNGNILTVDVEKDVIKAELEAQVNDGLQCAQLSPDQEILILVTKTNTVLCMVSDFQTISETNLHSLYFGKKQFVTIGWGNKETQFHGTEGKAAAKLKPIISVEQDHYDSFKPTITWRGDGLYFAVNFINSDIKKRQFKVFNREGTLQYTSEVCNGLEEFLSWQPSGSLIAATQKLANKYVLALFEKNGLKHREFVLPFHTNEMKIKDLFWSPDSHILSIWWEQPDHRQFLQLWMQNNYHWYLKQTILFTVENPLIYATWSTACFGKELILLTAEDIITYSFHITINQSIGQTGDDKAVVGVIDGSKVLLTRFRNGVVPPPMSHQEVNTDAVVNAIVFAPKETNNGSWVNSNAFFCVTENYKFAFFQYETASGAFEYIQLALCEIQWDTAKSQTKFNEISHLLWYKENIILCCLHTNTNSFLCVLKVDSENITQKNYLTVQKILPIDGEIEHIVSSPNPEIAYIVVEGSVVDVFTYTESMGFNPTDIRLQPLCYQINVVQIDKKDIVLALSHRNSLSADGKEIANNVTSMYVRSDFILLTTLQHTLICVPINRVGFDRLIKQDLTVKPWEDGFNDEYNADLNIRRIERGSLLITSISRDSKTILQMPRGNLECIQPRALSLHIIGSCLNRCHYATAFVLMRKQRIDLNLIYDHNPSLFVRNAQKFVSDIGKPSWLSLFLTDIQDEDVTKTVYAHCYNNDTIDTKTKVTSTCTEGKVRRVCNLLRDIMEDRDDKNNFMQPILISLVKSQERQGLEAALRKVREVKTLEEASGSAECVCAEEALQYLLYIVNVDMLFDTALGMYDFEMALFIVRKSQKDPKEYIPFLNGLKKLEDNYMKFSINMHLMRYETALECISKDSGRFDKCMATIRNHNLYKKGLTLFDKSSQEYKKIANAYGEYLLKNSMHQEAGIMFRRGEDFKSALYAYKQANDWQEAVIVAQEIKLSPTEMDLLYDELIVRLKENKRYEEVARIYMDYKRDAERAVLAFCDGRMWKHAMRVAYDTQHLEFIGLHIRCSVHSQALHIATQISQDKENFEKHMTRLSMLRNEMISRKKHPYDNIISGTDIAHTGGIGDMLSDTSSITGSVISQRSRYSTASGRSYRSSKNRRKQERKFLTHKEGSAFEDLGLMRALHEIITQAYKRIDEIYVVTQMLVRFDHEELAKRLQTSSLEFLHLIERSKSEIWDKNAPSSLSQIEDMPPNQHQEMQKLIEQRFLYPPDSVPHPLQLSIF